MSAYDEIDVEPLAHLFDRVLREKLADAKLRLALEIRPKAAVVCGACVRIRPNKIACERADVKIVNRPLYFAYILKAARDANKRRLLTHLERRQFWRNAAVHAENSLSDAHSERQLHKHSLEIEIHGVSTATSCKKTKRKNF